MYNLDFETIKQVMWEHQTTGHLYAEVPAGYVGLQEPSRIEIRLSAGAVVSCFIVGRSGQRLTEKESVKRIARLGRLRWEFTPQEEVSTALTTFPDALPVIPVFPRRTVYLEQWQMQSWPRLHRTVFALADGTRSAAKIAAVLSVEPEMVERTLYDLQSMNVVVMEPQNGGNR